MTKAEKQILLEIYRLLKQQQEAINLLVEIQTKIIENNLSKN